MLFYPDLNTYIKGERKKLNVLSSVNIPDVGLISKVLMPNDNQIKLSNPSSYSVTQEVEELELNSQGIIGDRHYGVNSPSTGREMSIFPKGTIRRNHRHLFAVSPYDCRVLSERLGAEVTPELLGANLVIDKVDNGDYSLSELPVGTRLLIYENDDFKKSKMPIAVLSHYAKQLGCKITGNVIAKRYSNESLVGKFIKASKNNRGITCSVEYPVEHTTTLRVGQNVSFKFSKGISP